MVYWSEVACLLIDNVIVHDLKWLAFWLRRLALMQHVFIWIVSIECPSIIPIFSGGSGGEHDCEDNLHSAGQWSDGALAKVGLKLASSLAQVGTRRIYTPWGQGPRWICKGCISQDGQCKMAKVLPWTALIIDLWVSHSHQCIVHKKNKKTLMLAELACLQLTIK